MIDSTRDLLFLAGKASLACLLTLVLDRAIGNPDSVSSTFVAVLAISPVLLMGLRLAAAQLVASIMGGIWGTIALALELPPVFGVPLAVGLAILTAFLLKAQDGYPVAAFTALYLVLVPRETPLDTFTVRLLAVTIGAFAGFVVNAAVSSLFYGTIFSRRVARAERKTLGLLADALQTDDENIDRGFARLTHLLSSLGQAKTELTWRHAAAQAATIATYERRVEQLRYMLHLACRLGYQAREDGLAVGHLEALTAWLREPTAAPPAAPPALEPTVRRLAEALDVAAGTPDHDSGNPPAEISRVD